MTPPQVALRLTSVSKHFGGQTALDSVDFSVNSGEVHALLGQNGSGKSTLVKIMTGVYAPAPGAQLELWGKRVDLPVKAAHEHGVAVIHQDLGLVEQMSVLENLGVTSGYGTRLLAPISRRRELRRGAELLTGMNLDIDLDTLVSELNPAARATIAIARAKRLLEEHSDNFVFILDEPTAYLNADEAARVVALMRDVANSGSAVVFISHRLQEVSSVADRITVLRDGRIADTFEAADGDTRRVIRAMLGRDLDHFYPDRVAATTAPAVLRVENLSGRRLDNISFSAAPGEIIGFAGLVGMGHEEIPYVLSGAQRASSGHAWLDDVDLLAEPLDARIRLGVSLVPGNRQRDGAWLAASAWENLSLPRLVGHSALRPLNLAAERRQAGLLMEQFGVRPPVPDNNVDQFSGGNQQKIVLAKWLSGEPRILLLDEPTQGVDAGAKFEVLQMVANAANAGAVVLVSSGDYEQLVHICTRVMVMRFGRIEAELAGADISEVAIAHLAQGEPVT